MTRATVGMLGLWWCEQMSSRRDAIRACLDLAETQKGFLTREQARCSGVSDRMIDRLIADGQWCLGHAGTLRLAGVPESWHASLMAAYLWAGPDSFASHRSAAALWELDGVDPGTVEISLYSGKHARGVLTHRLRQSDRPRTVKISGIPVTNVGRTLLDLAGVVPPRSPASRWMTPFAAG